MNTSLLEKYNVQGPRYTSYPPVPYWNNSGLNEIVWKNSVQKTFSATNSVEGISLYIHLPYCESLCTYCGCNTRITVNHKVEEPYIQTLLAEWKLYLNLFEEKPRIREIHLGGGTPTFFSSENLKRLLGGILETSELCEEIEFGFEGHPNYTSKEQLQALYDLGFRRVSFGIQDFDEKVQRVVNRIQSFDTVKRVTDQAREVGYESINFDLIYGLPFQRLESIRDTIEKVNKLQPDRIAFYSYAHVPWVKPGQRMFTKLDLPLGKEKRALYELGRAMLEESGYVEIGMDHFAKKEDALYQAWKSGTMHRNFMGYTPFHTELSIGLGASSISDSWDCFVQNEKKVEDYQKAVSEGRFPFFRGHILNLEDTIIRHHILNLMCRDETNWKSGAWSHRSLSEGLSRMAELVKDKLVVLEENSIRVTQAGRPFIRDICMALDPGLTRNSPEKQIFSSTV